MNADVAEADADVDAEVDATDDGAVDALNVKTGAVRSRRSHIWGLALTSAPMVAK